MHLMLAGEIYMRQDTGIHICMRYRLTAIMQAMYVPLMHAWSGAVDSKGDAVAVGIIGTRASACQEKENVAETIRVLILEY